MEEELAGSPQDLSESEEAKHDQLQMLPVIVPAREIPTK